MVGKDATRRIRESFDGRRQPIALAVYMAVAELVNDHRNEGGRVRRREIADYAGVALKAADDYLAALVDAGVLEVHRERGPGGLHLPNVWTLVEVGVADDPTPGPDPQGRGGADPQGRVAGRPPLQERAPNGASEKKGKKPDPDSLPDGFPDELLPVLEAVYPVLCRVAEAKDAIAVSRHALAAAIAKRPRKPHLRTAEALEHWSLFGLGQTRPQKDVVARFRDWLDREPDRAGPAPTPAGMPPRPASRSEERAEALARMSGRSS
jgi:hypothetical protein